MQNRKPLQRIPEQGKIAGVCAGVAEYTNVETWLVRVIWFSGFILSGGFFFIAYIAGWFILDKREPTGSSSRRNKANQGGFSFNVKDQWHRMSDDDDIDRTVEVKTKVWQAGEPPRMAFRDITRQFDSIERRVRNVEGYVTSNEFTLKREINRL
ncbi:MAG: envelope stress response membrane protein PspC [Gammaproteobacteria bacterium]|nr:envelope stress response membrane protein PspC [Gammaproteobacteria bacterium]